MEEWGPIINLRLVISGIFFSSIASIIWLSGHVIWLTLNGKKIPSWMLEWFDKEGLQQVKTHNIYVGKMAAWGVNIFAAVDALWLYQVNDKQQIFMPVIGDIMLANIGGIVFELALFFLLTGFFRWVTREGKR